MQYVVVFLAGAVAAASGLAIWYFAYISQLKKERLSLGALQTKLQSESDQVARQAEEVKAKRHQLQEAIAHQENRKVQYDELVQENSGLKQDLFNLSVHLKKLERDQAAIVDRQHEIDEKAGLLAKRYLDENVAWIGAKLTAKNFASSKQRLTNTIGSCRGIGFSISTAEEERLINELKDAYETAVREEYAREEQTRIKAQIREEERLAREIEKQIQDAERERAAVQAALEKALRETKDQHSAEVELLKSRLKEAEEKAQRAISMAQMTKAGYVYVISNIGSFGENVYKIGMSRRLEPMDRVRELSSASVPFPYDVHMMISCNDAPCLENALHREFRKYRVNRVNFHKEFFRLDLATIREIVAKHHGEVEYIAEPAALEYRESLKVSDEDFEFIEQTAEAVYGGDGSQVED